MEAAGASCIMKHRMKALGFVIGDEVVATEDADMGREGTASATGGEVAWTKGDVAVGREAAGGSEATEAKEVSKAGSFTISERV